MHEMKVADIFMYLVPSILIVIGMTVTLSYSFWKYHKRKMIIRKMQHDYLEVFLSVKRPRIGALRCNTHFTKWSDMAQSLSHSDFNRLSRYHATSAISPRLYDPPPYVQNGYLGQIREHDRPYIEINYASDNDSLSSSIPGETYKRNSYYEDRGLPPVPRKQVTKPPIQDQRRPSVFTTSFNLFPNTTKSSSDSELSNRKTEFPDSPRKLGTLEDGYWKRDSSRCKKPKRSALRKHSKKPRSLSQQYEYDLNLPVLLRQSKENTIVNLDIYNNTGNSEHYIIQDKMYNNGAEYQGQEKELQSLGRIRNTNPNSRLQVPYHRDAKTLITTYNLNAGTHNPNNGLQKIQRTDMVHENTLSDTEYDIYSGLPDPYTSSYNFNGNTNNPKSGLQRHYQRDIRMFDSEHDPNSGLKHHYKTDVNTLTTNLNDREPDPNSGSQHHLRDPRTLCAKCNLNDLEQNPNSGLQHHYQRDLLSTKRNMNDSEQDPKSGLQHTYQKDTRTLNTKSNIHDSEQDPKSGLQNSNHGSETAVNKNYNVNDSVLVWVNLDDIPQSCV